MLLLFALVLSSGFPYRAKLLYLSQSPGLPLSRPCLLRYPFCMTNMTPCSVQYWLMTAATNRYRPFNKKRKEKKRGFNTVVMVCVYLPLSLSKESMVGLSFVSVKKSRAGKAASTKYCDPNRYPKAVTLTPDRSRVKSGLDGPGMKPGLARLVEGSSCP